MKNLRKLRAQHGVHQEEVASAIGVSRQQYITYEKNLYRKIAEDKEDKLCEFFNCSLVELYGDDNFIHQPLNDEEAIFLMKILAKKLKDKDLIKTLWE